MDRSTPEVLEPGSIPKRTIVVAGLRAEYVEVGEGPPLLLLPSMLIRTRTYLPTIAHLSRGFRVVAVDLPGSGRSERLPNPWDFSQYADWTVRFLDAQAIERPVVLGHSNSAAVGMILAARFPSRMTRLILVDSVGAREDRSLVRLARDRLIDGLREMRLNFWGAPDIAHNLLVHGRNFRHQIRLAVEADLLGVASEVTTPTLIAWGRRDRTMPPECAERLRAAIPGSRIYLSEGSHDWLILDPAELSGAVSRFVEDLDLRDDPTSRG